MRSYRRYRSLDDYASLAGNVVAGLYFTAVALLIVAAALYGVWWLAGQFGWLWGILRAIGYTAGGIAGIALLVAVVYYGGAVLGWLLSWVVDLPSFVRRKYHDRRKRKEWARRMSHMGRA